MSTSKAISSLAILVDLDNWGRICDFSLEFQDNVEICEKAEPTRTKMGIFLDQAKTLTKTINCGNCTIPLKFNMIVRTAKARRKTKNKRKATEVGLSSVTPSKKRKHEVDFNEVFTFAPEMIEESNDAVIQIQTNREQIPQMIQEEIIVETLDYQPSPITKTNDVLALVYQCPICKNCFESIKGWQEHYQIDHQMSKSIIPTREYTTTDIAPITITPTTTTTTIEIEEDDTEIDFQTSQIEMIPEYFHEQVTVYTFKKCNSCNEPLATEPLSHLQQCAVNNKLANYTVWYFCGDCGFQTMVKQVVDKHIAEEHASREIADVTDINVKQEIEINIKEHPNSSQSKFCCPVCYKTFDTNKILADHMRKTCKIKWIHCEFCNHLALSEDVLAKHKEKEHGINARTQTDLQIN